MMNIYIPTLNRIDRQPTLESIPNNWLPRTKLVVHISEQKKYINNYGKDIVLPTKEQGIANVRQWIMENAQSKYVMFLDDDMNFGVRAEGTKLRNATRKDMDDLFILLLRWLRGGLTHVGISQRAGNNRISDDFVEITRMNNAYAYNVKEFLNNGIKFNRLKVMEDFDVTLSLLKKGIKNRVT
ncbi:MAG: GREB1-related protein, partial [Candidatus Hodarchaeales archaeon]